MFYSFKMNKQTICVFAFLLSLASTSVVLVDNTQSKILLACEANQYLTPAGCWNSCSDARFKNCGSIFPKLYNPSFCAYTKDGQYFNYTFECQACQNTNVVAVINGACTTNQAS